MYAYNIFKKDWNNDFDLNALVTAENTFVNLINSTEILYLAAYVNAKN